MLIRKRTHIALAVRSPNLYIQGIFSLLNLQLGQPIEAVYIPRGAFFQKTGGRWIYVVDETGEKAYRREIRIGRQNPRYYEILDGLAPGEKVITSSYDNFGDNEVLILKEALIQGRVCARCQSLLLPSSVDGYSFQCPHHDENLFTIETIAGEYTPVKFQEFLLDFFYNSNLNNGKTIQELKKKV